MGFSSSNSPRSVFSRGEIYFSQISYFSPVISVSATGTSIGSENSSVGPIFERGISEFFIKLAVKASGSGERPGFSSGSEMPDSGTEGSIFTLFSVGSTISTVQPQAVKPKSIMNASKKERIFFKIITS